MEELKPSDSQYRLSLCNKLIAPPSILCNISRYMYLPTYHKDDSWGP